MVIPLLFFRMDNAVVFVYVAWVSISFSIFLSHRLHQRPWTPRIPASTIVEVQLISMRTLMRRFIST